MSVWIQYMRVYVLARFHQTYPNRMDDHNLPH